MPLTWAVELLGCAPSVRTGIREWFEICELRRFSGAVRGNCIYEVTSTGLARPMRYLPSVWSRERLPCDALPGDLCFVEESSELYVRTEDGWYVQGSAPGELDGVLLREGQRVLVREGQFVPIDSLERRRQE